MSIKTGEEEFIEEVNLDDIDELEKLAMAEIDAEQEEEIQNNEVKDEDVRNLDNELMENENEDEENFGDTVEEKPSSLESLLGLKMTSVPVVVPVNSNVGVDTVSMPRQGQKKCGWKNKMYTGKGCGLIVGVRTGNCPKCNYQF